MSKKAILIIVVIATLSVVVVYTTRHNMAQAWKIIISGRANLWILSLLIPTQLASYILKGEALRIFLHSKGEKMVTRWQALRLMIECTYVDHVGLASGAGGTVYVTWMLNKKFGINAGKSAVSQLIGYLNMVVSSVILFSASLIYASYTKLLTNIVVRNVGISVIIAVTSAIALLFWFITRQRRVAALTRFVCAFPFIRSSSSKRVVVEKFLLDTHRNCLVAFSDKLVVSKIFALGLISTALDAALIGIVFAALGFWINPAIIFIAFWPAMLASGAPTPGGVGFYEATMIAIFAATNMPVSEAIAGTLLARVSILIIVLVFGFLFCQQAILKYGRPPKAT